MTIKNEFIGLNEKIFFFSNIINNGRRINATRSLWRTGRLPYW